MIIGTNVYVSFVTPEGEVDVLAKVDTGALSSSVGTEFFHNLKLKTNVVKSKVVRNAISGTPCKFCGKVSDPDPRDMYQVDLIIKGVKITTEINVFDRSTMKFKMILGKKDIIKLNALVDVKQEDLGS